MLAGWGDACACFFRLVYIIAFFWGVCMSLLLVGWQLCVCVCVAWLQVDWQW